VRIRDGRKYNQKGSPGDKHMTRKGMTGIARNTSQRVSKAQVGNYVKESPPASGLLSRALPGSQFLWERPLLVEKHAAPNQKTIVFPHAPLSLFLSTL
jgi:hypothetical protein